MFGLIKGRDLLSVKWSRGLHMLVFEPRGNTLVRLTRPYSPRNRRVSNFFGSMGRRPIPTLPFSSLSTLVLSRFAPHFPREINHCRASCSLSLFVSIFVPDFTP